MQRRARCGGSVCRRKCTVTKDSLLNERLCNSGQYMYMYVYNNLYSWFVSFHSKDTSECSWNLCLFVCAQFGSRVPFRRCGRCHFSAAPRQ